MLQVEPSARKRRPGYLFLVCPDTQILRNQVESLQQQYPPDSGSWERFCYWGDEDPSRSFWENLSLTGLFGSSRFIVVRQAEQWPAAVWHRLSKVLASPLPGNLPLFCLEVGCEKRQWKVPVWLKKLPCWTFAEKHKWIWFHEGLTDATIRQFIRSECQKRSVTIPDNVLERLAESVPKDAGVVSAEAEKLAMLAGENGTVSLEHLSTAEWTPEANIFACVDNLLQGREQATWKEFSRISDRSQASFAMIGLLALHFRHIWQIASGEQVPLFGATRSIIPALARRIGRPGAASCMALITETEQNLKTGRSTPDEALEFLIAQLLIVFKQR